MFRGKNKLDRARRRDPDRRKSDTPAGQDTDEVTKPRDWYDITMLCIEGAGVLFIVVTIAVTLLINAGNSRDMQKALDRLSNMAEAAQTQAAAVQTPHVRLWVEKFDFVEGKHIETIVKIRNASAVTLFNAQVSAIQTIEPSTGVSLSSAEANTVTASWEQLEPVDSAVIGPEEDQNFPLFYRALTPDELRAFKANQTVFVTGLKIEYSDGANRKHTRYLCEYRIYNAGHYIANSCRTPPQR